jgi:FkbH-like protein
METREILHLIELSDDPVAAALRALRLLPQLDERLNLLAEALGQQGRRLTAVNMREMEGWALDFQAAASSEAGNFEKTLARYATPAATWMRALLLEASGNFQAAAGLLENLQDAAGDDTRALRLLFLSKNQFKAGLHAQAYASLQEAAKSAHSYRTLSAIDRLRERLKSSGAIPSSRGCRVALVGTATLDLLVPALRAVCLGSGIDAQIFAGAYNQYQQEILDTSSRLAAFAPEIIILVLDWRSLSLPDEASGESDLVEARVSMLRNLWRHCRQHYGAFVIQHNFEIPASDPFGRLSFSLKGGRGRLLRQINLALADAARNESGVAVLDVEQIASVYGKGAWNDPVLWHTAKQYPASDAIPRLARHQVALLRATLGLSKKCLVLDLDGVLWGGVVGEDGLSGIELGGSPRGEAFQGFQRYVKSLGQRGIVLAVCSKNNEEDAKLPFREHPEMILSFEDISVFVANWNSKDENLRRIANELNLGLDSLVLADDSPTERAWVRRQLPQVEVPELPEDPSLYIRALDEQMYFEALTLTDEDRQRTQGYRGNFQRQILQASSSNVEEFLAGLEMQVDLRPFDEANLPRIVQLINKTNQFNLTTRRRSDVEVRNLMARPACYTQSMRLRDRFGDYGLTGLLIALPEGEGLRIDTWLMSCRVLGRQVERVMLAALLRHSVEARVRYVIGEYVPTAKNAQTRDLYDRLGFECIAEEPDGSRKLRWRVGSRPFECPACFSVNDQTQQIPKLASSK